jgi:uncharacterized membrane protein YqhA
MMRKNFILLWGIMALIALIPIIPIMFVLHKLGLHMHLFGLQEDFIKPLQKQAENYLEELKKMKK